MPPQPIGDHVLNWASVLTDDTRDQAAQTASMPFVSPHLALMPDAHLGTGATVGSVIPTQGAIIPAAVGVDIGCGMIAVRTNHHVDDLPEDRHTVRQAIEKAVPLSAGKYNAPNSWQDREHTLDRVETLQEAANAAAFNPGEYDASWREQLGTLGSGNHFIEITADEQDRVWLFLHSGSRGVGNRIASHHIKVAQRLCDRWFIDLPDPNLAYLPEGTAEFGDYIRELQWAQLFALLNREEMMDRVIDCFERWVGASVGEQERINCHHNYTTMEHHFGRNLWVTRKGAIHAGEGVRGLIPGSMGTASYVVTGLGNPASLCSAPHGAGRSHSRKEAKRMFTVEDLRAAMGDIEYRDSTAFVDEIPAAYKDIDQVMADAADLVRIDHTLRQLVNVKGD